MSYGKCKIEIFFQILLSAISNSLVKDFNGNLMKYNAIVLETSLYPSLLA